MRFDYDKLRPRVRRLANGIPLYVFPDSRIDLVRLEFIFEAGSFYQSKIMQAGASCYLLGAGTERYASREFSEKLDYYGAYIERYPDRDQSSIVFSCMSRYFDQVLPLCEEAVRHSIYPEEELETYLRKEHRRFLVNARKVSEVSRRAFYSTMFGLEHPYGAVVQESDFKALEPGDLRRFYKQQYVAENCSIVLAGNFTEAHCKALDDAFGGKDWSGARADTEHGPQVPLPPAGKRVDIPMEGSLQASVRIGMPVCSLKSEDFPYFKVVDYVLGGYFGSRLMRNIREEKGYTYGISSYVIPLRFQPVWMISSEVRADSAEQVIAEIGKEIDKLKRKEVPEDELDLVRHAYMGDFMRELDGTFEIAERMKFFISIGQGPEFYERNEAVLFSITPGQIKEAARKFLDKDRFCTVTAGAGGSFQCAAGQAGTQPGA